MAESSKHDAVQSTVCAERNTIGSEAIKLASKTDDRIEGLELAQEETKDYMNQVADCARKFPGNDGKTPFYVCAVQTKMGKLINVFRRRFFARNTVPAPTPATTVFKYFPVSGQAKLLWTLPNEQAIHWFIENWNNIPLDYLPLKGMIQRYISGDLHELMMKEDPSIAKEIFGK